jgi:predicted GNAT superfamily acetyltransferase
VSIPWLVEEASSLLQGHPVTPFDPEAPLKSVSSSQRLGTLDIGAPDSREAERIRDLQQEIWDSDVEALYPADIHTTGFGSSLTLVARLEGSVVAFLFGFHKFPDSVLPKPWTARHRANVRLESQAMGVLPPYRKRGIATALKRLQAEHARRLDLKVIEWTVDPLQLANAVLNYEHLGAIAVSHRPDYYGFRNQLNQVAASRVIITWLIDSKRVAQRLEHPPTSPMRSLSQLQGLQIVNDDWHTWRSSCTAPNIAVEIPPNWTALQAEAPKLAWRWRQVTDDVLEHYLGLTPGKYVITATGQDGSRRYLLARRVTSALLERLAE